MKVLLDTHAFIWWDSHPAKLSPAAASVIADPAHDILFSIVNIQETELCKPSL